jgi:hypothetical protein
MTQDCSPEVLRRLLDDATSELAEKDEEIARLREALAGKAAGAIVAVTPDELAQKDATIKALAEALLALGDTAQDGCSDGWHTHDCLSGEHGSQCAKASAALRMAGVLK